MVGGPERVHFFLWIVVCARRQLSTHRIVLKIGTAKFMREEIQLFSSRGGLSDRHCNDGFYP